MKIKRSSSKKQLHKWTKLGVGLAAVTVLGGGTTLAGIDLFHVDTVYAQAQESVTAVLTFYDVSDLSEIADRVYIDVEPGESISYTFPVFDGYTLHEDYDNVLVLDYDDVVRMNGRTYATGFRKVEKPAGDTNSTDTNTVNYTIQLVDQDGQVLQTIQQSGVEGTEVTFDFPVISGYRIGKTEGFESGTVGKNGSFRLVANKTVKVYYDKAPSIDSLIRPEQRVEYQKVFDEFHTTILKAFEVYKKELGVDDITHEANDLEKIFADSNLSVLHSELVLEQRLFAKPVGLVLTDQDIINAIGWTPEYWDHQIAYHKEIIQKLEKALVNIAASKAIPTVETPTEQPVEQPAETPVEQPTEQPVEQPVETPTEQPVEKPVERPTTKPTDQSASEKPATKQETKEQATPASQSKQSTDKPASTSQPQAKTLPATGEASSVLHLTGLGLLGLAGLVVKRRQRKSS
ncbi:TPA: LPXTG cell wall anchor domain-containing protein [Streptococcus suis]|nr:LPXTG cell wall anchor domain-containing protein [Streptococcus suis]